MLALPFFRSGLRRHALESEELALLEVQVRQYEEAVGAPLPAAQDQPQGVVPPLPQPFARMATDNKASWISPDTSVDVRFEGGVRLVAKFQAWALEVSTALPRATSAHITDSGIRAARG